MEVVYDKKKDAENGMLPEALNAFGNLGWLLISTFSRDQKFVALFGREKNQ
jgi:hypothetical protein